MNTLELSFVLECFEFKDTAVIWKKRPLAHFKSESSWSSWNARFAGTRAGTPNGHGYLVVSLGGVKVMVHRVAYALHYNEWPLFQVDHSNGDRTCNTKQNLRRATGSGNQGNKKLQENNSTGYKGVSFIRSKNLYRAQIHMNGRVITLGKRKKPEDAYKLYCDAAVKYFGEFAKLG